MYEEIHKMYRLSFYEEIVGTLSELREKEGFLIGRISDLDILFPIELEAELRPLVGTRLGILHSDIFGKEYLIRVLSDPNSDSLDNDRIRYQDEMQNSEEVI